MAGFFPPVDGGASTGGGFSGGEEHPPRRMDFFPHFLEGEGIERSVFQLDLARYIGPNARLKPGEHEVMFYCV